MIEVKIGQNLNGKTLKFDFSKLTIDDFILSKVTTIFETNTGNNIKVMRPTPSNGRIVLYQNEEIITLCVLTDLGFYETLKQEIKLSEDFGTVTNIDTSSAIYNTINVDFHEKHYVVCESMCKVEGLSKDEIEKNIEDAYSNEKTYDIGDYCIYEKCIYKCNNAITEPEEFDYTKWTATTIATELKKRLEFKVVEVIDESE